MIWKHGASRILSLSSVTDNKNSGVKDEPRMSVGRNKMQNVTENFFFCPWILEISWKVKCTVN
jgi:hypothetical protein